MTQTIDQTKKLIKELEMSLLGAISRDRDREEQTLRTYTMLRSLAAYARRHAGSAGDLLEELSFFQDAPTQPKIDGTTLHVVPYTDQTFVHAKVMIDELILRVKDAKTVQFGHMFYFYGFLQYYRGTAHMVTTMYTAGVRHDVIIALIDKCFPLA